MRKFLLALVLLTALTVPFVAFAGNNSVYVRGKVLDIIAEGERDLGDGSIDRYQTVSVEFLSGTEAKKVVTIEFTAMKPGFEQKKLYKGETIVVGQTDDVRGRTYYVQDAFRLPIVAVFLILFFVLATVFGRGQGARSVLGLGVSLLILMVFVVPRIFAGESPLLICAIGSSIIAVVSILLAHGLHRRSFVALLATLLALVMAFIFASLAVHFTTLSGSGTEEAVFLQLNYLSGIDLRGLLLGGMVIGALGVLDDVTTAQVAAIEEIHNADASLDARELYARGSSVGREHIASLVNTLALAYVGASFPIFLLFSAPDNPPLWVLLNSEQIMEEAVRALVGGSALILAVPISTAFAAFIFSRLPAKKKYV
ncbi:MAG: YibE/F family protein [Patescibacteria group bacterium]|jgi:uncharacterized membrane protein